ncbi:MAG: replication-associated recombination protein A [Gammaproteobacteria bacterium]|jgi:putative ATPase|nr:replication-associated recombination protein A [Gammaproteobacteria bacterium]
MSVDNVAGEGAERPLADRLRPQSLEQLVGQEQLLGEGKPLRRALLGETLHSMVLWGPPGSGKTTMARVIASHTDASLESISAVLGGVKDIRAAVERARFAKTEHERRTIVFVDEVHRFNKAQQDAFLPHIEDGTIAFIGATTENPAFELNNALLSRLRVYVLKPLPVSAIRAVIDRAVEILAADEAMEMTAAARDVLADFADGDARRALNLLEIAVALAADRKIDEAAIQRVIEGGSQRRFDKGGDDFYDQISAFHKSVRGSDPDAALYWFARMLDGGCDPAYIVRRVVRIASEDVGNADPRALGCALDAWAAYERLGSPEGDLAIGQAIVYCACAAKSNAVYRAFDAARDAVAGGGSLPVPNHIRNAPTRLAKRMGHGQSYRYDHDEPGGVALGQRYFPEELGDPIYYKPVDRGLELKIAEKLDRLRGGRK